MAPKRKSLALGAEVNHTPLSLVKKSEMRDIIAQRGFVHGQRVDLRGLEDLYVQQTFGNIGWAPFLTLHAFARISHIREFYTGYRFNDSTGLIDLEMYDRIYTFDLEQFCNILKLPRGIIQLYNTTTNLKSISAFVSRHDLIKAICQDYINPETTTVITENSLRENVKDWNKIVVANIFPRGGDTRSLAALQAYLLYCLAKGIKDVDIGYIVAKRMSEITRTNRRLPYGLLLNRLFEHLHLAPCAIYVVHEELNATTIRARDHVELTLSMGVLEDVDVDDEVDIKEDWRDGFATRFYALERDMRNFMRNMNQKYYNQHQLMRQIYEHVRKPPCVPD